MAIPFSRPGEGFRRSLFTKPERADFQLLSFRAECTDSGINAIIGRIPADDDDEEVIALLEELS